MTKWLRIAIGLFCIGVFMLVGAVVGMASNEPILHRFHSISLVSSTVPANGDVNPYGVAQVKRSTGNLTQGNILVSNFNNLGNQQGTGTTIVQISPDGSFSQFARIKASELPGPCIGGVGLTTALVVLRSGWVIVGSLPTANGMSATMKAGCLIVLDSTGHPAETFYGSLINGPWDMTASEHGDKVKLFYTNVLNGTVAANGNIVNGGTIVRMDLYATDTQMPAIESMTVIGSGFEEQTSSSALVVGPTGVGLVSPCDQYDNCTSSDDDSYDLDLVVADTLLNRIQVIPHASHRQDSAGTGLTLSSGGALNGPLGLTVASNGEILTVNGGDGRIVEISPNGTQVATKYLDTIGTPPGNGALFGLAFDPVNGIYFVDDNENQLNVLH
jgi:hypothetical protein